MLVKVYGAAVQGIDATIVTIEVNSSRGIKFFLVGLPDSAVKESHERIISALQVNGYKFPTSQIVINMAPADIRKEGSSYALPLAIGILAAAKIVSEEKLSRYLIIGELSLDGSIQPIKGALPIAIKAREDGFEGLIIPQQNAREAAVVNQLKVYGVSNIKEVIEFFNNERELEPTVVNTREEFYQQQTNCDLDFADVKGQENVKRALEVAAAGGHNLIMVGAPGSGKSMMAKRLPSILPPLSLGESLETTKIHSVAGQLKRGSSLISQRPFRDPHHTISQVAMVGGGSFPQPGEISLAHHGILFLDELAEFKPGILDVLREPLEEKKVHISRVGGSFVYPADFMLVGAMNPCKCGYYPDRSRCNCSEQDIKRYIGKISMPLWDRFDMCIKTDEIGYEQIRCSSDNGNVPDSESMKQAVMRARLAQLKRFNGMNIKYNSQMSTGDMKKFCRLGEEEEKLIKRIFAKKRLTARGYSKILKTARTIADIDGNVNITTANISEAFYYRGIPEVTIH